MTYSEWLRQKGCSGKSPYNDKREALAAARDSAVAFMEPREAWNAYYCKHCRKWHVGHRRGWKAVSRG